jgi:hypothetical protein
MGSMAGSVRNFTIRMLGHDGPETTFKHYAKVASKGDAGKFRAIAPRLRPAKNVVQFRKAN